uniref:Uncharacterized protein n=1 Tax=Anguilla anguilla TaxID=7936 RepID=A0A0E9PD75_ANGAN
MIVSQLLNTGSVRYNYLFVTAISSRERYFY